MNIDRMITLAVIGSAMAVIVIVAAMTIMDVVDWYRARRRWKKR